jgi:uncharacterized protein with HEPN domain
VPPKKAVRAWPLRLDDMIEAARRILEYTSSCEFDAFAADRRTIDAVIHNFTVLGEASRHVPPEVEAARADIPWPKIRTMRNFVVHVYHAIDLTTVWATIRDDLPVLLPQLEAMLAEIDRQEPDEPTS